MERTSRSVLIFWFSDGEMADSLADILIDTVHQMPAQVRGSLTWDLGTEMSRHAALAVDTYMEVFFAHRHPHSP